MKKDTSQLLQKVGAEMFGTFALVFVGCGAVMSNQISHGAITHVGISLSFGLVVMTMIYATGHISGAHFNPAVTLAFASIGKFTWKHVPAYIVGQTIAALLAATCLYAVFGPVGNMGATIPAGTISQSFVLEFILSAFLMFVITSVATDSRAVGELAGWAIGATVAMEALIGGPISGASMNPARSIGPALVSGQIDTLWLYLLAPALGALVGAHLYNVIRCGDTEVKTADGCC